MVISLLSADAEKLGFVTSVTDSSIGEVSLKKVTSKSPDLVIPAVIDSNPVISIGSEALPQRFFKSVIVPITTIFIDCDAFSNCTIGELYLPPLISKNSLATIDYGKIHLVVVPEGFPHCTVLAEMGINFIEKEYQFTQEAIKVLNSRDIYKMELIIDLDKEQVALPLISCIECKYELLTLNDIRNNFHLGNKEISDLDLKIAISTSLLLTSKMIAKCSPISNDYFGNNVRTSFGGLKVNSSNKVKVKRLTNHTCALIHLSCENERRILIPQVVDDMIVTEVRENSVKTTIKSDSLEIDVPISVTQINAGFLSTSGNSNGLVVTVNLPDTVMEITNPIERKYNEVNMNFVSGNKASIKYSNEHGLRVFKNVEQDTDYSHVFKVLSDTRLMEQIQLLPLSLQKTLLPLPRLIAAALNAEYISSRQFYFNGTKGLDAKIDLFNLIDSELIKQGSVRKIDITQAIAMLASELFSSELEELVDKYITEEPINLSELCEFNLTTGKEIFEYQTKFNEGYEITTEVAGGEVVSENQLVNQNSVYVVPASISGVTVLHAVLGKGFISSRGVLRIPEGVVSLEVKDEELGFGILDLPSTLVDLEEGCFFNVDIDEVYAPVHLVNNASKYFNERTSVKLSERPSITALVNTVNKYTTSNYISSITKIEDLYHLSYLLNQLRKDNNILANSPLQN